MVEHDPHAVMDLASTDVVMIEQPVMPSIWYAPTARQTSKAHAPTGKHAMGLCRRPTVIWSIHRSHGWDQAARRLGGVLEGP
jgi:hypothetical protein